MNGQVGRNHRSVARKFAEMIPRSLSFQLSCRQCGETATWWHEVCQSCGAADPVRLPLKWLFYSVSLLIASGTLILVLI